MGSKLLVDTPNTLSSPLPAQSIQWGMRCTWSAPSDFQTLPVDTLGPDPLFLHKRNPEGMSTPCTSTPAIRSYRGSREFRSFHPRIVCMCRSRKSQGDSLIQIPFALRFYHRRSMARSIRKTRPCRPPAQSLTCSRSKNLHTYRSL